jgi:hypothetical protein
MHLVQLLLPLHDNNGRQFSAADYSEVRKELTDHFGGVTAFVRSPAVGLWKESPDQVNHDEVIMFEVLTERLDKDWWAGYRKQLQHRFHQDEVMIWAAEITRL